MNSSKSDKKTIKNLEIEVKEILLSQFDKKEIKDIKEFLNQQMTSQETILFYNKIKNLRKGERIDLQLEIPNKIYYAINFENKLKEQGFIYNGYLQQHKPLQKPDKNFPNLPKNKNNWATGELRKR